MNPSSDSSNSSNSAGFRSSGSDSSLPEDEYSDDSYSDYEYSQSESPFDELDIGNKKVFEISGMDSTNRFRLKKFKKILCLIETFGD